MGGGRKRGRTQRRHFKRGRENVWKHEPRRPPASGDGDGDGAGAGGEGGEANPSWQPFATENQAFEEYYKEQQIVPEEEWDDFMSMLRKPLPAAFRINASCQFFQDICSQLENDFRKALETEVSDEYEEEAIRPLPWYPGNLAWHLNFSRMQLRRNQSLESFHEFLKQENEVGNITRQEAVSMVPPLFLNVQADHHILDMCAAPGSKTFQLLEMIHQSTTLGLLPSALVIANDVDVQRCNLLIHQTKRMCTANLIVTNHEAQNFPSCSLAKVCLDTCKEEAKPHRLQFDRVLCDVPCSGDGTVRKAPDMWRKWNAGMGNGVHRLQVEIAMRGIALLKVGGRMVYSTCSMNPVENEAVVAELLRRSGDSVELLDVSGELPELVRRPGLRTWKVRDKGSWFATHEDVPRYRKNVILPSMFPSGKTSKGSHAVNEGVEVHEDLVGADMREVINKVTGDQDPAIVADESSGDSLSNLEDSSKVDGEFDKASRRISAKNLDSSSNNTEYSSFPLHRCMRIVPHDQNSGAFFIAVLQKLSSLTESHTEEASKAGHSVSADTSQNLKKEHEPEIMPSEDVSFPDQQVISEADAKLLHEQENTNVDVDKGSSKDKTSEEGKVFDNGENGQVGMRDKKRKLQNQGRWRGVDPVIFFKDEATIKSIVSFYGISESFPLEGHLVTRNADTNHVKRIYYVSKSVQETLELNLKVGERLKITSLGLKVFERQTSKDGSPCTFRLSSEGLPLLLPYIKKQILYASPVDFQHLLQYRTIKFPDFVDAKFGEEASALMPGCCVVVLHEGQKNVDPVVVDLSTIAIVCWKGKTNLCVMVSPLDGKELLQRIAFRYGLKVVEQDNERCDVETDEFDNAEGDEGIEMVGQELLPEGKTPDASLSDDK